MSEKAARYVRFVTEVIDDDSGHRRGIFQAVSDALADIETPQAHCEVLRSTYDWFNANLAPPERFARSKRTTAAPQAISWFKHDAAEHIAHMRSFCNVLEECGVPTRMITTGRPGYIVYEDAHQVVAVPFRTTCT